MSQRSDLQRPNEEFQDPLENYDPKTYDDPLQQALADETVTAIQSTPFASISTETTVGDAVRQLAELHVGCLLVEQEGRLVGIFSHRDVLDKVATQFVNLKDRPVAEVMTEKPVFVFDTDSSAAVLCVMAVSGYRHVPVLNSDKQIIGIASPQRVTQFLQQHFERH